MKQGDHLFLIDGSSYIFRAYHALPPLTRKRDNLPVGAVAGFCNMMWKLLAEIKKGTSDNRSPATHLAVIFDYSSKSFRKEIYPAYKENRSTPPEDLIPQFSLIRQATRAFQIPYIEKENYEADDIIATYACQARDSGADVTIVSSDKDLLQLVDEKIILYDGMKDHYIGIAEVIEKWGVPPQKMVDLQAMAGDSSDNVPGIPGIGPKTAALLLNQFGNLDTILNQAEKIPQKKRRETIIEHAETARMSRKLVQLKTDLDLDLDLDSLLLTIPEGTKLVAFLKAMEFTTLTRRVAEKMDVEVEFISEEPLDIDLATYHSGPETTIDILQNRENLEDSAEQKAVICCEKMRSTAFNSRAFHKDSGFTVTKEEELKKWLDEIQEQGFCSFTLITDSLDAMRARITGFSLGLQPGKSIYIPLEEGSNQEDLLTEKNVSDQMKRETVFSLLKPIFEDLSILKIGFNVKYDWLVLYRHKIHLHSYDDIMLMSYVLGAGLRDHSFEALSLSWLHYEPISSSSIQNKSLGDVSEVSLEKVASYALEKADIIVRLWMMLSSELLAKHLVHIYARLEKPLIPVLAKMEMNGILVDAALLKTLSEKFEAEAKIIEKEIYRDAGEEFNIGSPKQLSSILFDKLNLSGATKTKTGQRSTSAQVLEELAMEGHSLASKIIEWRQIKKLQSTYTDALPHYIHPKSLRVHTNYGLAATLTGRLSSNHPNLQNIPIRTSSGRLIREAFIAAPGHQLISADYSQIELRVLADIADIAALKNAFANDLDIHTLTAAEMFHLPVSEITKELRYRAKAINFGIIYGISAFGLANQIGISREEASDYIQNYFEKFPGIREYIEQTKKNAREHGYVETIFGRRIYYPEIRSKNAAIRNFNERAAINAPIQGSAADIIRRAMIHMDKALEQEDISAKMLLQVHDELVFEVSENEISQAIRLISRIMEEAPLPALQLSVPLKVEVFTAKNWRDAH